MKNSTWNFVLSIFFFVCLFYNVVFVTPTYKTLLMAIFDAAMMIIAWLDFRLGQIKEE